MTNLMGSLISGVSSFGSSQPKLYMCMYMKKFACHVYNRSILINFSPFLLNAKEN